MDALYADQVAFGDKGSLRQSVDQAQHTLELLENARSAIFESGQLTPNLNLVCFH